MIQYDENLKPENKDVQNWSVIMHLSQLLGFVLPIGGLIAPIAIWLIKKEESKYLDETGKEVVNFIINIMIAGVVMMVLCFLFVGIILAPLFAIAILVLVILAGVRASEGKFMRYPFIVRLIK